MIVLIAGGPAAVGVALTAWACLRARARLHRRAGWLFRVTGGSPSGLVDYRRERP